MKKLFVVLFCVLLMSAPSFADEVSYEIDPVATANAKWEVGARIPGRGQCLVAKYYRKFLGVTTSGLVLVQDFYLSGKKLSNPFLTSVKEAKDIAYGSCPKVIEGIYTKWYENGQKWEESFSKNGELEGIFTWWYENGQKLCERNYKNGKLEGLFIQWHENGQKQLEVRYENDKEEGLETWWYENGQKQSESNNKNGRPVGIATHWHENGQKQSEFNYKDDGRFTVRFWDEKGNLVRESDENTFYD